MIQLLASTRSKEYPIYISGGAAAEVGRLWAARNHAGKLVIITDSNVADLWLPTVEASFEDAGLSAGTIVIDAGEASKTLDQASALYTRLFELSVRRRDTICAVGGGVVGDLAGFIASTYMRGIGLIQVPTTLLAQVDSSIGGKTGVNIPESKNYVGSFYQPDMVVTDTNMLRTLPREQLTEGLAEVVKYALLSGDDFFAAMESSYEKFLDLEMAFVEPVVRRCIEYKLAVVSEDECDKGRRAVLNLGHTVAHGIEAAGDFTRYSHGQAVSLGLITAVTLSTEVLQLPAEYSSRLRVLLDALGLPTSMSGLDTGEILRSMASDKKADDESINMVLLQALGEPVINCNVLPAQLEHAVRDLQEER